MKTMSDIIHPKLQTLEIQKEGLKSYLLVKSSEFTDFHSISDVANDLRDIDSKIEILKWVLGELE